MPPTGEGFGLDFIVSDIKLGRIRLYTCCKGSDGLGGGAIDVHPLYAQQLNPCIRFLSASGLLNGIENAVSTELILYGEEGFGAGFHDLEEYVT